MMTALFLLLLAGGPTPLRGPFPSVDSWCAVLETMPRPATPWHDAQLPAYSSAPSSSWDTLLSFEGREMPLGDGVEAGRQ